MVVLVVLILELPLLVIEGVAVDQVLL